MKRIFTLLLVAMCFYASMGQKNSMIIPGKYIVKFKEAGSKDGIQTNYASQVQTLQTSELSFEIHSSSKVFPNSQRTSSARTMNSKLKTNIDWSSYYYLNVNPIDAAEVIKEISRRPDVEYIEPVQYFRTDFTPNDEDIEEQDWLANIGAFDAWDITQGSGDIVVAIIDSGVDYEHEDLSDKIYTNDDEIPGNKIDDDNDGYVDNFYGWDFVGDDYDGIDFDLIAPDNNPIAKNRTTINHGTTVAGCSAASTNNGVGVAGVGFNAKYMALKCSSEKDEEDNGRAFIVNAYEAVVYAAENGAHVINMSFGGGGYSQAIQDIMTYAALEHDVVLVSSAGNGGTDNIQYPGNYDHVLSVAATDINDEKAGFSEHGSWVDISAPGVAIYTTEINNGYVSTQGTSFSAPIVAGAAALLRAHFPNYNQEQIRLQLIYTADDVSELNPDFLIGGRLNVFKALTLEVPGITVDSVGFVSKDGGIPSPGDSVILHLELKNVLSGFTSASTSVSVSPIKGLDIAFPNKGLINTGSIVDSFIYDLKGKIGEEFPFETNADIQIVIEDPENSLSYTSLSSFLVDNPIVFSKASLPFTVEDGGNFEAGLNGFAAHNISGTGFERGNSSVSGKNGTASGDFAWVTGVNDAEYENRSKAYLYTPIFDFSGLGTYTLSFYANYDTEFEWDGFIVEYSTDQENWIQLDPVVEEGWYDVISVENLDAEDNPDNVWDEVPIFTGNSAGWKEKTRDVSHLFGSDSVGFRFHWRSDLAAMEAGIAIDDFSMDGPASSGPAVPDFITSAETGCVGLEVTFTNATIGPISSIEWDFGSGASPETASGIGPHEVVYSTAGTYTASVTVEGVENGLQTEEKIGFITVGEPHKPTISLNSSSDTHVLTSSEAESYQWYFEGNPVENETNQSITITENGNYSVETIVDGCAGVSDMENFTVILSIDELKTAGINLYPNPVRNGQLNIEFSDILNASSVEIFSLSGRRVLSLTAIRESANAIDVSKLEAGLYFVKIKSNDKGLMHKIIIE